jgi:flagellar motility protein MotE (MotC chaperone)
MPSPTAAGLQGAPEPTSIRTVADLAVALKNLRLCAPRRELTDDLVSLRRLSELTDIPRSTLCNAESGRILPSARVVFHVARACGVDQEQLAAWVDARHRVARSRSNRTTRPEYMAMNSQAGMPDTSASANENSGTDGLVRIVGRLEAMDPDAVMPMLRHLPSEAIGMHLAKLHAPVAAQHLSSMKPGQAAEALAYMSADQVAECMGWMEPSAAQGLLGRYDPTVSIEFLRRMPSAVAASIISAMPAEAFAETLSNLPPDAIDAIIPGLPLETQEALVTSDRIPDELAVKVLFGLSFSRILALLESLPSLERCAELLTAIPADAAAGLLAALKPRRRRTLLDQVGVKEAGRMASLAPAETVAEVLSGIAPRTSAAVLGETGVDRAASVLNKLPREARRSILECMSPLMATVVRNAQIKRMALDPVP